MSDSLALRIDLRAPTKPFRRFWRSTGFTPAELLLEPEMRQTLDFVAGVPRRGIEFLRVHYLLDLVTAQRLGSYDWSLLDEAIDAMIGRRLRPVFEIMGNPSRIFDNFEDHSQICHWRDMIAALVSRYIQRYGREEVAAWYFETWNEPDLWWRFGATGFNNYYDACTAGLWSVDSGLRLGGPGTARTLAPMFKSFTAHVDSGANYFSGEKGQRIDFISVHEKGAKKHAEDITPDTVGICRREMQAVNYLRQHHPRLASLPFINDECDPQIGWILYHTWHATPYFAGAIAKIIDQHQRLMVDGEGVQYELLSNDNGFMGRWGHRTQLAYFGGREVTAAQSDHVTRLDVVLARRANVKPFELVKKPALSVMELLAYLGEHRIAVEPAEALAPDRDGLGVIATKHADGRGAAILVYNSVDRIWESGRRRVALDVSGLAPGDYTIATFSIERDKGDPFSVWERLGANDLPDAATLAAMRAAQEPVLSTSRIHVNGSAVQTIELDLQLPSASLVIIEPRATPAQAAPSALRIAAYPGLNEAENIVLSWDAPAGGPVQLYDVLCASNGAGSFTQLNPAPLLSTAYLLPRPAGATTLKVRTRTLAGDIGPESTPIHLPD
jgi:L-iduronidase